MEALTTALLVRVVAAVVVKVALPVRRQAPAVGAPELCRTARRRVAVQLRFSNNNKTRFINLAPTCCDGPANSGARYDATIGRLGQRIRIENASNFDVKRAGDVMDCESASPRPTCRCSRCRRRRSTRSGCNGCWRTGKSRPGTSGSLRFQVKNSVKIGNTR